MGDSSSNRYSDEDYVQAVRQNQPAGTSEVADAVGVARQSADYRLRQLKEDGKVTSKMVGGSLVWMTIESDP